MKVNAALNFVVPLYHDEADADPYAYVHATPIATSVFEANFRLLIRTYQTMMEEGPTAMKFARLFMRDAAAALVGPNGNADAYAAPLVNEISRLSHVMVGTPKGWESVPLQQAISSGLLDDGDGDAAMGAVICFLAVWHVSPKQPRQAFLETATQIWGAVLSPLQPSEWIASLPTSIGGVTSGQTVASISPQATDFSITVNGTRTS